MHQHSLNAIGTTKLGLCQPSFLCMAKLRQQSLFKLTLLGHLPRAHIPLQLISPNRMPKHLWKNAEHYTKTELDALISRMDRSDPEAVEEAIAFTVAESFGIWHGRARAKICRQLKNHPPPPPLRKQLVQAIISRLVSGNFSEQFKDQLAMAIRFEPSIMHDEATRLLDSPKEYVERYAHWVIHKVESTKFRFQPPDRE